jgi:V8-like Glu-specific endopeptidase
MEWYQSIVRIKVGNGRGTGVMIAPGVALTAAHVLQPAQAPEPTIADIVIELPWLGYDCPRVLDLRIHPTWRGDQTALTSDVAIVRVDPTSGIGLETAAFDPAREVSLYGFPLDASDGVKSSFQNGHLRRVGQTLYSRSFDVGDGMSGGPFLQFSSGLTRVIGIATWDSNDPSQDAFNGIPIDSPQVNAIWP